MIRADRMDELDRVFWKLVRHLRQRLDAILEEGATAGIWMLLQALGSASLRMSDLAAALQVSQSTATATVDRGIAGGWVERLHDPKDRRTIWVRLTTRGEQLLARLEKEKRAVYQEYMQVLSEAEQDQLLVLLTRVVERVEKIEEKQDV